MKKIHDDSEDWESGKLGQSEEFAAPAPAQIQAAIDDDLGLQPITLRLQKTLVEDLKVMAKENGLGYQPFVRQLLTQYVREHRTIAKN
jgi:predicted DNA binding CopG/RHH family protein